MTQEAKSRTGRKAELAQGDLFAAPEAPPQPAAPPRKRAKAPARKLARKRGRKPKAPELKMARESLTLPPHEQKTLYDLQLTLRKRGRYDVTRSLILRAGIAKLAQLPAAELQRAVDAIARGGSGRT